MSAAMSAVVTPILAWWFGPDTLPNGDGRPITVGCTLTVVPPVVLYEYGLHGSRQVLDALRYASCSILWRTEHTGEIRKSGDRLCSSERRHIARLDAESVLHVFGRRCALDVLQYWDAPAEVRQYLETGDESLRATAHLAASAASVVSEASVASEAERAASEAARWAASVASVASEAASEAARWAASTAERWAASTAARTAESTAERAKAWAEAELRYAGWLEEMCLAAIANNGE